MDLFQLLGTIAIKNSDANRALDETSAKGEQAQGKLSKAFTSIGKGAIAVGKTIATGMAVGATAVAGVVTQAVQSYADYEQLVGGVDTLFKESSAKVQKYAEQAYETAGLSANEYMETVTSFSASLLQSLGGDTEKAADKANTAIIDMADNANKMGTSMEMIQNAYQGFAKQNYTMLDNLKLGYGGTKEEMERLLADAQAISGVEYDMSKYADVVDAIHVIQTEMGITGTTSKEAAGTISGSMASVKASWKNLLTAVASDELPFDEYMNRFVESASTMAKNMLPRIKIALGGVGKLVEGLAPTIGEVIPELISSLLPSVTAAASSLVTTVVQALPGIVTSILDALPPLVDGFIDVFGILIDSIPTILSELIKSISKLAPKLISGISSIVVKLCQQIPNILGVLVEQVPTLLESVVTALLDNLPMIIDGLILMLGSLVNQLPMIVDTLTSLVVNIITMVVEQLPVILPVLLEAVISLLTMIIEQLPAILPMIVEACLTIIRLLQEQLPVLIPMLIEAVIAIVYLLIEQLPIILPMLIEACITIVMAIVQALPDILKALIDALPGALQAVWDAIVMVFKGLPEWFGQLFRGAVDIIKELFSPIAGWFSGIWEKIKDVFAPVIHFFDVTFGNAWRVIEVIWSVVGTFFNAIWQIICAVFRPVVNFFKDAFQSAWNAIKNVFSGVGQFFSGIWNTIKDKFSGIGTKISDAISGAVRNGINGLLGSAESIINGFLKMINGAIGLINKIPGVEISKVKMISFTKLAEGGVVDEPTPALFGEDGAEAVVPLEKNTGWLKKVAKQIHEFSMKDRNDLVSLTSSRSVELQEQQLSEMQTLNNKVDRIISLLVIFFPEMIKALDIKLFLDKDKLIAETKEDYDAALGELAILKGRGY